METYKYIDTSAFFLSSLLLYFYLLHNETKSSSRLQQCTSFTQRDLAYDRQAGQERAAASWRSWELE
jgi:hypothetical protein